MLCAGLVFVIAVGAFGAGASQRLSSGGFNEPGAESSRAERALRDKFRTGPSNVLLLVTAFEAAVAELGLRAGQVVLDAGSGTGRAIATLHAAVGPSGEVLAVDVTAEMMLQRRGRAAPSGLRCSWPMPGSSRS